MTQKLLELANKDTPEDVVVPNNLFGFLVWATIRLGNWVIFAFMLYWVYADQQALTTKFIENIQNKSTLEAQHIEAIRTLTDRIEQLSRHNNYQQSR